MKSLWCSRANASWEGAKLSTLFMVMVDILPYRSFSSLMFFKRLCLRRNNLVKHNSSLPEFAETRATVV